MAEDDNPFADDRIPPEHVVDELQWCKKEVGYARTETSGTPNRRLSEVFERLKDLQDMLSEIDESVLVEEIDGGGAVPNPHKAHCDKCEKPPVTGTSDGGLLCEEHAEENDV